MVQIIVEHRDKCLFILSVGAGPEIIRVIVRRHEHALRGSKELLPKG